MSWNRDVDVTVYVLRDRIEIWTKKGLYGCTYWFNSSIYEQCRYRHGYYECQTNDVNTFISKLMEILYRCGLTYRIEISRKKTIVVVR